MVALLETDYVISLICKLINLYADEFEQNNINHLHIVCIILRILIQIK